MPIKIITLIILFSFVAKSAGGDSAGFCSHHLQAWGSNTAIQSLTTVLIMERQQ